MNPLSNVRTGPEGTGVRREASPQGSDPAGPSAPSTAGDDPYESILCQAIDSLTKTHNQIIRESYDHHSTRPKLLDVKKKIYALTTEWKIVCAAAPVRTEAEFEKRTGIRPEYHEDIRKVLNQVEAPLKQYQLLKKGLVKLVMNWDDSRTDHELILQYRRILVKLSTGIQTTDLTRDDARRSNTATYDPSQDYQHTTD